MAAPASLDIAVALHWDGQAAPRVTATGRGETAARIIALARQHDVPIDTDPALVEVLAQVELGTPIPEKLFAAVAEVIAFAYAVRGHLPAHLQARLAARPAPAGNVPLPPTVPAE